MVKRLDPEEVSGASKQRLIGEVRAVNFERVAEEQKTKAFATAVMLLTKVLLVEQDNIHPDVYSRLMNACGEASGVITETDVLYDKIMELASVERMVGE